MTHYNINFIPFMLNFEFYRNKNNKRILEFFIDILHIEFNSFSGNLFFIYFDSNSKELEIDLFYFKSFISFLRSR